MRYNRSLFIVLCLIMSCATNAMADVSIRIVSFGDSTTFEDPSFKEIPPGGGPETPIVSYSTYLSQDLPGRQLSNGQTIGSATVINKGVSGNNTTQAKARFNQDVLAQNPNIVIIQFGWNDQAPKKWGETTPPGEIDKSPRVDLVTYRNNLEYMVSRLVQANIRVIMMTPDPGRWRGYNYFHAEDPYVGYDPQHPEDKSWKWGYNTRLEDYCEAVRGLAATNNVELLDVHSLFRAYDAVDGQDVDDLYRKTTRFPNPYLIPVSNPPEWLPAGDGVHPASVGHRFIADALLDQITSPVPEPGTVGLLASAALAFFMHYSRHIIKPLALQHPKLTRRGFLGQTIATTAGTVMGTAVLCQSTPRTASAADTQQATGGWQIGCWTRPWAKYDYHVAMDAVAEAGFTYISFTGAKTKTGRVIAPATPIAEAVRTGEEAKKRGLKISYVYGGGLPLHEGPDSLRKMIDNCAAARGRYVVIAHIGSAKHLQHNCKVIASCCDYAAEKNVGLVIKPHGGLNATGILCRQAIEKVGHKNFTLLYDPGNVCYYSDGKIDPIADATTTGGLVTGMSVKDFKHPKQVDLTPGSGQIDFAAVMKQLRKGGFTHGPLAIECLAPGSPEKTLKEARKARQFVEDLIDAA